MDNIKGISEGFDVQIDEIARESVLDSVIPH